MSDAFWIHVRGEFLIMETFEGEVVATFRFDELADQIAQHWIEWMTGRPAVKCLSLSTELNKRPMAKG